MSDITIDFEGNKYCVFRLLHSVFLARSAVTFVGNRHQAQQGQEGPADGAKERRYLSSLAGEGEF